MFIRNRIAQEQNYRKAASQMNAKHCSGTTVNQKQNIFLVETHTIPY